MQNASPFVKPNHCPVRQDIIQHRKINPAADLWDVIGSDTASMARRRQQQAHTSEFAA